ncbi:glycosyltransferase [Vagococcus zengguangii]|uniref:glycosyltransferase n=1 Tax=Vagococcus zengguangii TaxID=2571750 RepID=UPI00110934C5|nr:glycosyltransferase [Vagococcus zengguangii]TLG80946.1 glycosyltransferase [Vagococcus zengguangii]
MKVLIINSVCGVGSTGRICESIAKEVNKVGEAVIAYGRGNYHGPIKTYKIETTIGVAIHGVQSRVFSNHGRSSKRATIRLISYIEEFNPDVINIHNIHGYYLNYEILFNYFKSSQKKIVWTLHDQWPVSPHAAYIEEDEYGNSPIQINNRFELKEYPKTFFWNPSKKNYNLKKESFYSLSRKQMVVVTPSDWLKDFLNKTYMKKYSLMVINNGIDLSTFRPNNIEKTPNKKILLGVANYWDRRKGLDFLLELSMMLDDSYELIIVGETKKDLSKYNITHIPRTNNVDELVNLYSNADIFINPTLADNFPTTNLESLACGTPVITFSSGGSGEAITSKVGRVLSNKNSAELYSAVKKINKNQEIISECLDKASEYDEKKVFKLYVELFERLQNSDGDW